MITRERRISLSHLKRHFLNDKMSKAVRDFILGG